MLPTLLIVEDERATREGLRSALEEEFEVYTAAGTGEALAILKSESIKLLLTDLRLGGDSGMDLLDAALLEQRLGADAEGAHLGGVHLDLGHAVVLAEGC